MTKIERAIEHFEGMVQLAQNRHPHPDLEFWQAALSALRAQQESEKGCKFCRDGDTIALDSCSAVRIGRDGQTYVMGGSDWESKINYCPMCGRNLRPQKETHDG